MQYQGIYMIIRKHNGYLDNFHFWPLITESIRIEVMSMINGEN